MMFRLTLFCCLLIMVITGSALAQWTEPEPSRFGFGYGFFIPTDDDVKDSVGSTWSGPTATYTLKFDDLGKPASYVGLGFFSKDGSPTGYDATVVPLTYTLVKRTGDENGSWYGGGGAGAYYAKFKPNFGTAGSSTHTKLGVHVLGGREFGSSGAFVEVRYDFIPDTGDDLTFTGLTGTIGLRKSF